MKPLTAITSRWGEATRTAGVLRSADRSFSGPESAGMGRRDNDPDWVRCAPRFQRSRIPRSVPSGASIHARSRCVGVPPGGGGISAVRGTVLPRLAARFQTRQGRPLRVPLLAGSSHESRGDAVTAIGVKYSRNRATSRDRFDQPCVATAHEPYGDRAQLREPALLAAGEQMDSVGAVCSALLVSMRSRRVASREPREAGALSESCSACGISEPSRALSGTTTADRARSQRAGDFGSPRGMSRSSM